MKQHIIIAAVALVITIFPTYAPAGGLLGDLTRSINMSVIDAGKSIERANQDSPPSDLSQVQAHIIGDFSEAKRIWQSPGTSTWSQIGQTVSLLGQVTTLAPLLIGATSLLLYPFRRLLLKSGRMVRKIDSWQTNLNSVATRLRVSRSSLIRIQEIKVDNRTTNIGSIGSQAIVNITEFMANVTNAVTHNVNTSAHSDEVKSLVTDLTAKIMEASAHIDSDKAKEMGADLETLSKEMTQAQPIRKWYELSLSGLKEAAEAVGQVGKPILEVIGKLAPLLLGKT